MKRKGYKRIGIHIDDYKRKKFKSALESQGYKPKIIPFMPKVYFIYMDVPENEYTEHVEKIGKICSKLQIDFNRSN